MSKRRLSDHETRRRVLEERDAKRETELALQLEGRTDDERQRAGSQGTELVRAVADLLGAVTATGASRFDVAHATRKLRDQAELAGDAELAIDLGAVYEHLQRGGAA